MAKSRTVYMFFLLMGFLCFGILAYQHQISPIPIVDAYVINLDKSHDRWEELVVHAKQANLHIQRWKAIDGTMITEEDARHYNVSKLILRHTIEKGQPGVVGCYLSHKTLLIHLETTSVQGGDGHLILEDDAAIPADFWHQWNTLAREIPSDWDIVQIGVTYPNLKKVPGCERLHIHSGQRGNVGAFAYVVRHSSLRKINEYLTYMYDPIDVMIRNKQEEWRIYYAWPQICPHNDHGVSTIVQI